MSQSHTHLVSNAATLSQGHLY